MSLIYYVIIIVVLATIASIIIIYNRLIKYSNAAEANLGQIRVSMKKRLDMIEQLLGAIRGYLRHEKQIFENITKLRSGITDAGPDSLNDIDKESRQIMHNIIAVAEAYPDLKASQTVTKFMDTIVEIEDEISHHRYTFNNIVQEYNTMIDSIPSNFVASITGSQKLKYLEFEEEIEQIPDVSVD